MLYNKYYTVSTWHWIVPDSWLGDFWSLSVLWRLLSQVCEQNKPETCSGLQSAEDWRRLQHPCCDVSTRAYTSTTATSQSVQLIGHMWQICVSSASRSITIQYSLSWFFLFLIYLFLCHVASSWSGGVCFAQTAKRHGSRSWWKRSTIGTIDPVPVNGWVYSDDGCCTSLLSIGIFLFSVWIFVMRFVF